VIKIDQILKIYLVWACGSDYSAEKKNCAVSVHACINLLLHPDLPLITNFWSNSDLNLAPQSKNFNTDYISLNNVKHQQKIIRVNSKQARD